MSALLKSNNHLFAASISQENDSRCCVHHTCICKILQTSASQNKHKLNRTGFHFSLFTFCERLHTSQEFDVGIMLVLGDEVYEAIAKGSIYTAIFKHRQQMLIELLKHARNKLTEFNRENFMIICNYCKISADCACTLYC